MAKDKTDTKKLSSQAFVKQKHSGEKSTKCSLSDNLKQLSEIVEWFENQRWVDIEEGLKKVKEAVVLINISKERLKVIENEFEEIEKKVDINEDNDDDIKSGV